MGKRSSILVVVVFAAFIMGAVYVVKQLRGSVYRKSKETYGNVSKVKGGPYGWVPTSLVTPNLYYAREERLWDKYL